MTTIFFCAALIAFACRDSKSAFFLLAVATFLQVQAVAGDISDAAREFKRNVAAIMSPEVRQ